MISDFWIRMKWCSASRESVETVLYNTLLDSAPGQGFFMLDICDGQVFTQR